MLTILDDVNESQKQAIVHVNGPLAVIAGAGSGKTRVITKKIAYLIAESNIKPWRILAVTFTNKAANEMRSRLEKIIGADQSNKVNIFTYHALCARILREEIEHFGYSRRFTIMDNIDQKMLLGRIYKKYELSSRTHPFSVLIDYISKSKNKNISPEELIEIAKKDTDKIFAHIYKDYLEESKRVKSLDFDDLLLFVHKLFRERTDIRDKWAQKYDYLLIDEFQDTSIIQYEIIRDLAPHNNITVVGDPDQTIYSWRNADVRLINDFKSYFKDSALVKLEHNYRSTGNILDSANQLIKNNTRRIDKKLIATKQDGQKVEFFHGFSDDDEARWVVRKIQELKRDKIQLKEIAILYRANYLSANIEKALIQENIKYIIYGGYKFFQRSEVKDVLSFLKVINNGDEISLRRVINVPARKIGSTALEKIIDQKEKFGLDLFTCITKHINKLKISDAQKTNLVTFINLINKYKAALNNNPINEVIKKFLFEVKYFQEFSSLEEQNKIENINAFIEIIKKWEDENPTKTLDDYIEEVSLFVDKEIDPEYIDHVLLMTVHSAKGLEFDNVFIIGFSDGVFPSSRSLGEDYEEGLEEERRLAYVAITRAREKLFITDSKGYSLDHKFQKKPSRFLPEMKIDYRDFTKEFIPPKNFDDNYEEKNLIEGDEVFHITFGTGVVLSVDGELIEIQFKKPHGTKTLMKNHKSLKRLGE